MFTYPNYVHQTLARAREQGQWYCGQVDAAALCFDILALFPDCREAKELVYQLFCDEWTIYDNRVAIQQNIEKWDDRPWQQRRRLALSFRFMSRWEGTDYAWTIFAAALNKTSDLHLALFWIGKTYADLGFFSDAAEVLGELCSRFEDAQARRLLAEVIWWRDNAHRTPWIPPAGNGSRYDHMMNMDFCQPYVDFLRFRILDISFPNFTHDFATPSFDRSYQSISNHNNAIGMSSHFFVMGDHNHSLTLLTQLIN